MSGAGWAQGWPSCLACGGGGSQPLQSRPPGLTAASSTLPLCGLGQMTLPLQISISISKR